MCLSSQSLADDFKAISLPHVCRISLSAKQQEKAYRLQTGAANQQFSTESYTDQNNDCVFCTLSTASKEEESSTPD
jgi:hypothetical protein